MTAGAQFVFGYGSLAAECAGPRARLQGHRRVWGVAMDNRLDIPGYKSYRRPDGSRPAVYVAFLDIVEAPGAAVDGVLLAVDDDDALRALDARERNYDRVDVTATVVDAPATVWTYRGSDAGRERLRTGVRTGSAVVDAGYLEAVRATFSALGIDDDVRPGDALPAIALRRLDLPPAPQA
jgi:hypothetical protein